MGNLAEAVCERARWSDLVVLERSGDEAALHDIIQHVSRPVLLVPGPAPEIKRALLVYDGSPKGKEALYVADLSRLAVIKIALTIFATREWRPARDAKDRRQWRSGTCVKMGSMRAPVEASGPIAEAISESASEVGI